MNYTTPASPDAITATIQALAQRNVTAVAVKTKEEALAHITKLIPAGASIMNGSSTTLNQIGFIDYLTSGTHGWNNLHEAIIAEKDPAQQAMLRKQSVLSDYYIGSVHGLAQTGEFVIASNTGSQLPHIVFTSPNLIFVVSTKKIMPTLQDAIQRVREHVVPLEDERAMKAYGSHTALNKMVIFENENPHLGRSVHMILVEEDLGF